MEPPVKTTRHHYGDSEKAQALALCEATGSLSETARLTGIPISTLSDWKLGKHGVSSPDIPILREGYDVRHAQLAAKFDEIAELATGEVRRRLNDPKKVRKIPLQHVMRAATDSVEKSQLLNNLPTSISGAVMSEDERKLRLAELILRARSRQQPPQPLETS